MRLTVVSQDEVVAKRRMAEDGREAGDARRARRGRWVTFAALLAAMPVPIVVVGRGHLPVAALTELAVATFGVGLLERADGVVGLLGGLLLVQGLVWTVAAWILAGLCWRVLGRATLALVVLGLATALVVPVYDSPFHASRAHQTLIEVYQ
jgi:hypothetical protein